MKVGIDQPHTKAPQASGKRRTSQLRRVRTSKMLTSDAEDADFRMTGSSPMAAQRNPTAHFSDYILGAHKTVDKPQHASPRHPTSKQSDPVAAPSTSAGSSHRPLVSKGFNAPGSTTTSLVAMIHGIFGGRETSAAPTRPNLNLRDENAFACLAQHDSLLGHSSSMILPARESRQEESSHSSSDGSSGASKPPSKGIPIQRTSPTQASLDDDSTSSESPDEACKETYDWATWRMYHRIVDHRAKYPVNASYRDTQQYGASGRSPRFSSSRFVDSSGIPFDDLRSQLLRGETPEMDGEVFHLEM